MLELLCLTILSLTILLEILRLIWKLLRLIVKESLITINTHLLKNRILKGRIHFFFFFVHLHLNFLTAILNFVLLILLKFN